MDFYFAVLVRAGALSIGAGIRITLKTVNV
jgi:hypothetical protein